MRNREAQNSEVLAHDRTIYFLTHARFCEFSDTNSGQDRVFIQDEINALNTELNRIASTTQFNGMNLLDGTFTNVELQVGADVGQKVMFGVNNADNATLGSFQLSSAF